MAVAVTDLTIPDLLADVMKRRRLSERGLSKYLGVSANAVNAWRRGIRKPEPESCLLIAHYTGLPLADVLRAAGHPAPDEQPEQTDPPWLTALITEMRALQVTPDEAQVLDVTVRGLLALREEKAQYGDPEEPSPEEPEGSR